jgi:hypothetical protein
VCVCLSWAAPAVADAVTHWNAIALTAVTAGRAGPIGNLDLALVQAAVHDAVQAFEGRYEPYHAVIENASGSPNAAVAAAAHGVLVGLYPAQQATLDKEYMSYLMANGLMGNAGIAVGEEAAEALLPLYRPNLPLPPFTGPIKPGPGEWRPTPPANAPMAFLTLAFTEPFTLLRPSQFRPQPPPPLTSEDYRREYDEVKALGARVGSTRTVEQTNLAYFWSENFGAQWFRVIRAAIDAHPMSLGDSARLCALASLAIADAAITAWDSKYVFNFWRPITAIREGANDGNPRTVGDPTWESLINTPPYPDYTSGANNLTGAFTTILQLFFGTDEFEFTITSNAAQLTDPATRTRNYSRFSQAAEEVVEARILLGIHFRAADEEARRQGSRVAHWVFQKFLRPVPGSKHE